MSLRDNDVQELARALLAAEMQRAPIEPLGRRYPELAESDAYRVQEALVALKIAQGARVVGRKVGATNAKAQASMGFDHPSAGVLFDVGQVADGGRIATTELIHPRLECEIAFVMGSDLRGPGVTPEAVLAATAALVPAFEIVDARTAGWAVTWREMIPDNVFQARYVLGDQRVAPQGRDLASVELELVQNNTPVLTATGAAVLGNPAQAVAWLVDHLAGFSAGLSAGDIVLAGSLTPLHPVAAGDSFVATFSGLGQVSINFD